MPHGPAEAPELPHRPFTGLLRLWAIAGLISILSSTFVFFSLFYDEFPKAEWLEWGKWLAKGFSEGLYRGVQLVLLHLPHDVPWEHSLSPSWRFLLGVAQFCAVIFVVLSPAVAAEVVFHKTIKEWWTLLRGHHVIICGAHRAGEVLKKEFEGKGHRVLQIDAATDDALNRADVKRAQYLVAVMDDDGDNIAVAQRAREITGKPQQVFVHVARPDLRALLRHQRILQWEEGKPRIRLFDIYENTARLLLRDHYLDYKPIEKNDGRVVQLVVIGFGRMGGGRAHTSGDGRALRQSQALAGQGRRSSGASQRAPVSRPLRSVA